jgi:hypothetical protein
VNDVTINLGIRLWTDFASRNDDSDDCVSVVGVGGGSSVAPQSGDVVILFDGEGHSCEATVEAVLKQGPYVLVYSRPEMSTWIDEEEYSLESDLLLSVARAMGEVKPSTEGGDRMEFVT